MSLPIEPRHLVAEDDEGVGSEGEEMREIEREDEQHGDRQAQPDRPLAQRDPACGGDHEEADAAKEIDEAPEQDAIVEQQERKQRPRRPAIEEGSMQRRRAAGDQQEDRQEEGLAGPGERHDAGERRDDEIHREIGDRLPIERVELPQQSRAVVCRLDMHAREMVGIVEQRRRRDG